MPTLTLADFERATAPPALADAIDLWLLADPDPAIAPRRMTELARGALERLLAAYAGEAVTIERDEHGKPFASRHPALRFNMSHSGHLALIAIARGVEIGVDVERPSPRARPVLEIAERYFAASEAAALRALTDSERPAAFLRLWTGKEAVLKALGRGIAYGLDRVAFTAGADHAPRVDGAEGDWHLVAIEPAADAVGALAWRGARREVRAFRWR